MPTTYAIPNGRTVMDASLYTGNATARAISNADNGTTGFKPDFVWIKGRSNIIDNVLNDSVRGASKYLISNKTDAEGTAATGITSFDSGGFSLGTDTGAYNGNGITFVAWQWQAGQGTTSNNTSGSITSIVSVNQTAGFSIVTWTGTGATGTIGHGLGATPSLIIVKNRSVSGNWSVWFTGFASTEYLLLNLTDAKQTNGSTNIWSGTPTSSLFSIGSSSQTNGSTNAIVAYCWTAIPGFSAFGSYTGNGSTDGPFVYTGFRPKFVLIKNTSTTGYWMLVDSTRGTYNIVGPELYPNVSDAEDTTDRLDLLSNGFKIRVTSAFINGNTNTMIYAAFAENPFKYANAR